MCVVSTIDNLLSVYLATNRDADQDDPLRLFIKENFDELRAESRKAKLNDKPDSAVMKFKEIKKDGDEYEYSFKR